MLGVEAVLPDGELVHLGGALADTPGPNLLGLIVGSEGTLAVVTSVTVRILRRPETVQTLLAAFDTIEAGGAVVTDIIGAGHHSRGRRDDGQRSRSGPLKRPSTRGFPTRTPC